MRTTYSRRLGPWLLVCALWLTVPLTFAQTSTGVVDGVIRDPSGGALPGVQVVANSPALIQKDLTVYSNADGCYRLPLLPPGTYTVTYVLQGFQTVERPGLIVNTGVTTNLDMQRTLASVAESVTVVGESPTVDPKNAQLTFSYTQALLENIPAARVFTDLVATIPAVPTVKVYGTAPGNVRNENVMGAGPFGNVYMMDGYSATDPSLSTNQSSLISCDTIEEVQVVRGAKPAEIGFAPGGFVQIITKSGSNQFSGDTSISAQTASLQSDNIDDRLRRAGVNSSDLCCTTPTRVSTSVAASSPTACGGSARFAVNGAPISSSASPTTSRRRSIRSSGRTRCRWASATASPAWWKAEDRAPAGRVQLDQRINRSADGHSNERGSRCAARRDQSAQSAAWRASELVAIEPGW